jgi:hypothetical protein
MPVLRMALRLEFHEAQAIFFLPSMPRKVKVEIRPRQKKITRRIASPAGVFLITDAGDT